MDTAVVHGRNPTELVVSKLLTGLGGFGRVGIVQAGVAINFMLWNRK